MSATIPTAEVIRYDGTHVRVRCPYCHGAHEHVVEPARNQGRQRRAPGCGLYQPADVRAAGYVFELPADRPGTIRRERGTTKEDEDR